MIVVAGDHQDHLVNWNDNRVNQENGHFSSSEEIHQNPSSSFGARFGFRSPDESSSMRITLSPFNQQEEEEIDSSEESSPLGLKLNKSPSLINLLERRLSEGRQTNNTSTKLDCNGENKKPTSKIDDYGSQPNSEKLKAANFPAQSLAIGTWKIDSLNESHLVVKCYFAKRKLVWEVLEGRLKSKIEIQWSDIMGMRATIAEDQPGVLEIELNQPPSYFRETNPQPRKHTLWQQASDFTEGQAPICRRHYVRFAPGVLDKHYEKLLQCDGRLQAISQRPFPSHESPYFESNAYGMSEFSLDFNGYGSQFYAGLQYPYQTYPAAPVQVQNLRQTARPPFRIMDPNFPTSVNDYILENQRRALCREANFANANHNIHLQGPNVTPAPHAKMDFSSHMVNAVAYEEVRRKSNADRGVLSDIENHLLGENTQMAYSSDDNTSTSRMASMYPLLDPEELANHMDEQMIEAQGFNPTISGGLVCYPEPTNWIPHDFNEGMATNNSPYPYALAAYPMSEEFSNSSY